MKNYKVKACDLYVGMDLYHVEGTGYYAGRDVIVRITGDVDTEVRDETGARLAGSMLVETGDSFKHWKTPNGKHWMKPDDIVYPVIESQDVTVFTKLKWRFRWMLIKAFK